MSRDWLELQRPMRLSLHGFWTGFNKNTWCITGLLESKVSIEWVTENPDVILASVFGGRCANEAFSMMYIGEPKVLTPKQANWADYTISFDPDSSNNMHLPHWQHDCIFYDPTTKVITFSCERRPLKPKTEFMAIFAGHDNFGTRGPYFDAISRYRSIDSYGGWRRNKPSDNMRSDEENRSKAKMSVLDRYRYSLALENIRQNWYTTEKLTESFMSNTVPIYCGAPNLSESVFNLEAMIDVTHLDPSETLKEVFRLEQDPMRYEEMLQMPIFSRPVFPKGLEERSERLIARILEERH
jgi:hypothetical protein